MIVAGWMFDDGTIGSRRGSLNVDDEGQPTQKNVLIENGVLRGYLQDRLSSRLARSQTKEETPRTWPRQASLLCVFP